MNINANDRSEEPHMAPDPLRINADRLWRSLMELSAVGGLPNGGVCRLALSDSDKAGRDLFIRWCEGIGLHTRIDSVGNLFARRAGGDSQRAPVVTGSHLDTQPNGGRFDGAYGVMAGLEVMRTLREADIQTRAPLEVAVWTNEEGTRFAPSMMGSMVFAGLLPQQAVLQTADATGITVGAELQRLGYASGAAPGHPIDAYFEAHIEQGPVLEARGCSVGVVIGGQGQCWYDAELRGFAVHAGTTPISVRRDALVGAAAIVTGVREIGTRFGGYATVGHLVVEPNSRNVIPDGVRLTIEIRHPDDSARRSMDRAVRDLVRECARAEKLECDLARVLDQPATPFDATCVGIVRAAAAADGFPHMDIVSGAAHDAIAIARVAPTAMIFVPCKDGVSHNERESATPENLAAGCQVLLRSMLARANAAS